MRRISVITVNLNNKAGLRKTFESVINQPAMNSSSVVVDGASVDGSVEVIKEFEAELIAGSVKRIQGYTMQ